MHYAAPPPFCKVDILVLPSCPSTIMINELQDLCLDEIYSHNMLLYKQGLFMVSLQAHQYYTFSYITVRLYTLLYTHHTMAEA